MTSKRPPKWKKKGYASADDYRAACATTRKTQNASLTASKSKNAARVLRVMWQEAEFDKPQVTITKEQIMALAPCSLSTVKRSLKELREEGTVRPMKNWQGGRNVATTWRLSVAGSLAPPDDHEIKTMEAARDRDAAWRFLKNKFGPLKALELLGDPEENE